MSTVMSMIERTAERCPDDFALFSDGVSYTYEELMAEVRSMASTLASFGIGEGSRVSLLFRNSPTYVIVLLALWKIRACAIPLNHRLSGAEMRQCVSISESRWLLHSEKCSKSVESLTLSEEFSSVCFIGEDELCSELCGELLPPGGRTALPDASAEALNIFTGGTTGGFKASVLTYRSLFLFTLNNLTVPDLYVKQDVLLNYAPLFHIGGLMQVVCMLAVGAQVVLIDSCKPKLMFDAVIEHRVTQLLLIPPTIVTRFSSFMREVGMSGIESVRMVQLSGGSAGRGVVRDVFEVFPNTKIEIGYGMSELAASITNIFSKADFEGDPSISESVGWCLPADEARLVDAEGNDVAIGEVGELLGRSPAMFSGYRTAETIGTGGLALPVDEDGWYATGDLMRQDERGSYRFASRKKDMIKSGGENVYVDEVEHAILTALPGAVKECAVVGLRDLELDERIVAAVVLAPGFAVSAEEIAASCRANLAGFKCPKRVFLLDELPRTDVGKVRKDRLASFLEGIVEAELAGCPSSDSSCRR